MTANRMKKGGLAANPPIPLLTCRFANGITQGYNSTFVLFIQGVAYKLYADSSRVKSDGKERIPFGYAL